jgi:hypothetical protein
MLWDRLAGGKSLVWSSSSMKPELLLSPGYILVKPKNKAGATFSQTQVPLFFFKLSFNCAAGKYFF